MNYIGIDGNVHSDELCHYGVIGMKWGVRKERKAFRKLQTFDEGYDSGERYGNDEKKRKKLISKANKIRDKNIHRSLNKLARIEKSVQKNQLKAGKQTKKQIKYAKKSRRFGPATEFGVLNQKKYTNAQMQSAKYQSRATEMQQKGQKWADRMNKEWTAPPVSKLSAKQIYAGRKYCVRLVG